MIVTLDDSVQFNKQISIHNTSAVYVPASYEHGRSTLTVNVSVCLCTPVVMIADRR